ncbi:alpha/beta fold hydrolase [Lunatimonas sp.]|uniref:alpha/beta fold hydrolase n=1 Tax=Lunatimonas sp. TaxID=2060141 RepID=UPI00263AD402|nr:alpha/beta fold hydrolase [Lunatimonas sp.]
MRHVFPVCFLWVITMAFPWSVLGQEGELQKRKGYLQELLEQNRPHPTPAQRPRDVFASFVRLSAQDSTWDAWQSRTGELPPNFDRMPSIPLLPDPLVWNEGEQSLPITNLSQWYNQRDWMKEKVKELFAGTFPDPPKNMTSNILEERLENEVLVQRIELRFGAHPDAKLNLEVFTPPGEGPFPVFITQWNHRGWAQIAVRRGYMGVIYAGADEFDDTILYQEVYPGYDWTALMTRAWGASRAVDYLYTLAEVDKAKIALTGHSRNGKLSLLAGAFDPRFTAIISSSGGTGGEIPYRYTDERHENESLDYLNSIRPQWFHPRLRFYNGREHKLPIDQNSLMALIAPNALLLSSSIREGGGGDPWAIEQNFHSVKRVYAFLGSSDRVGLRFRDGGHGVAARDLESYVDWLDIQFGRSDKTWINQNYYPYDFESWSAEQSAPINPMDFPELDPANPPLLSGLSSRSEWIGRRAQIREGLDLLLGKTPAGIGPAKITELSEREDYMDQLIQRPNPRNGVRRNIAPYRAMGDYQYAALYFPADQDGKIRQPKGGKFPVIIWSHKFINTGFDRLLNPLISDFLDKGIAVMVFDQLGYGSRIEEGTDFYERYPGWSKMGKMVADTRAALDALQQIELIDENSIYLGGYSLGGTISLLTAAMDDRVAGVAAASAFTPWRIYTSSQGYEGIRAYSHLYGLIPRLGYFLDNEKRLPVDFPEILAAIAPKPLLLFTPEMDRHADLKAATHSISLANRIYGLHGTARINQKTPKAFGQFTPAQQKELVDWVFQQLTP